MAKKNKIPVFTNLVDLKIWLEKQRAMAYSDYAECEAMDEDREDYGEDEVKENDEEMIALNRALVVYDEILATLKHIRTYFKTR